jgi:cytochrome b561
MTSNLQAMAPTPTLKPGRYHPALVTLHWVIALLIIATALLAMGGGEGRRSGAVTVAGLPLLSVHMILGITVLVLLVLRLAIRWRTQRPDWATTGSTILDKIGELTHWALYFFTFAITITGLILAMQTNRLARIFTTAGAPRAQFTPGQSQPGQFPSTRQFQPGQFPPGGGERGEGRFTEGGGFSLGAFHGLSWVLLFLLILLHVGAALYHQFLVKDNLLGRMWFGKQTG